jgi:MOSC domain-containing protein YiiM
MPEAGVAAVQAGGRVVGLNVSSGGVPKRPIGSARVTVDGVEGDHQRDRRHHGGPDRAVCLYAVELIEALRSEGHPIGPGSIGENLTVRGLDWSSIVAGACLLVGMGVVLEVTAYASPCANIAGAFADGDYGRVSPKRRAGWSRAYARVRREGIVTVGDPIRIVSTMEADGLLDRRPAPLPVSVMWRRGG